jgi:phosphatidate cytidylyltransferase
VGLALGAAAIVTLIAGRLAVSLFVGALSLAAYVDLRRLLSPDVHPSTFVLGALGVGAFLWAGYTGELDLLPAAVATLVMALLVTRIVLHEAGSRADGVTADLAATLGACGVVGVLGAHILLVRAVPRVGFRGLVALGVMVVAHDVAAFFVGRFKGRRTLNRQLSPQKTWEGALAGFAASVVAGGVVGVLLDPPFDIASGLLFGVGVGVLASLGDLAFSAIKRSAGVRHSGTYLGSAGGLLDVVDSALFAAPAFYWAFRTIAL